MMKKQNVKINTIYNPKNKLVKIDDVLRILNEHGSGSYVVDDPVDITLFILSFVNKSYCTRKNQNASHANIECPQDCLPLQEMSNERLEFLGDAILNLVTSDYLYKRYTGGNQVFLTKMRSHIVNGKTLAKLSSSLGFGEYMIISKQIEDKNGRCNINLLEDTFEAFVGAMFKTLGYNTTNKWVIQVLEANMDFSNILENEKLKSSILSGENRHKYISDVLLNTHIGEYLYKRYYKKDEGFLTTMRSKLINKNMVSYISDQYFGNETQFEKDMSNLYLENEHEDDRFNLLNKFICNTIEETIDFVTLINCSNYKDELFKFFQHNMSSYPVISIQKYKNGYRASVSTKSNDSISYAISHDKKNAEQDACKRALQYYGKNWS